MLCIEPRIPEAYDPPAVFYDMIPDDPDNLVQK